MFRKMVGWELEFGIHEKYADEKIIRNFLDASPDWLDIDLFSESFTLPDDFESVEIQSKPMPYHASLKKLRHVLKRIRQIDAIVTTEETGVHVGISYSSNPNIAVSLSSLDIMALFDEMKWLKEFNRDDNPTCAPHLYELKDDSTKHDSSCTYKKIRRRRSKLNSIQDIKDKIEIVATKYTSVNFGKVFDTFKEFYTVPPHWLSDTSEEELKIERDAFERDTGYQPIPYWEIRCAGGEGYEYKFKQISEMIKDFSDSIDSVRMNDKQKINRRLRKIFKLNGKGRWESPTVPF